MIALPIILAVISVIGIKFSRFHNDYMGLSQTTAIKGVFAAIIVMSHLLGYVTVSHPTEVLYKSILGYIGQLMVALFFFYSGYGVVVSYAKKSDYLKTFIKNRFLKILVHFDLAVLLFAILNLIFSIEHPAVQYVTCWFAWGTIGNSNWFIFDTLVFYLIAFVAMTIHKRTKTGLAVLAVFITALCAGFWFVLRWIKGIDGYFWYDTVFCFPAGIWYAVFKEKIDTFAKKWYFYIPSLGLIVAAFAVLYGYRFNPVYYSVLSPVFCLLLTFVTMRVKLDNKILAWLGKHSFSIYIIQRIPMIILARLGLNSNNNLYTALVVITVFPVAWLFSMLLGKVDGLLFKKEKN